MKKSISVYKKGPGRPATGQDTPVSTRLPESTLKAVEKWAERNDCTRSEAIRRLVELALKAKAARRPYSKKAADQAADLAERQIDRLGDQSATAEEKKSRKQRLLKGPPEFRGLWKKPSDPS